MNAHRLDDVKEGNDAEGRVANVLHALATDDSPAADVARWLARNWLHARRGIVNARNLTPEPDVQRVLTEALEVDDSI